MARNDISRPGSPRPDRRASRAIHAIARDKANLDRIITHWPDMLRVAGSLVTNQVRAYDLLRMLTRDGHPTPLGHALAEYGRIAKTLHLLAMVDPVDETYRRTVTRQLNIGESRHSLARKILHGHHGDVMQPYRAGQEDQLGALGLAQRGRALRHPLHRPGRHRAARPGLPGPRRRRRPLVAPRVCAHHHTRALHLPRPVERAAAQAGTRSGYRWGLMP